MYGEYVVLHHFASGVSVHCVSLATEFMNVGTYIVHVQLSTLLDNPYSEFA